jgi:hypothetical protein
MSANSYDLETSRQQETENCSDWNIFAWWLVRTSLDNLSVADADKVIVFALPALYEFLQSLTSRPMMQHIPKSMQAAGRLWKWELQ